LITSALIAMLGVLSGIMAGLLPAIPAWLMPFLLLPFLSDLSVYQVTIFWLTTMITSQFFGSISSISFGIPGENSSLIYINETNKMSGVDRTELLRQTADASAIATIVALGFAMLLLPATITNIHFFNSTFFTFIVVYWAALMISIFSPGKNYINLLIFLLGVVLASHDNIALPEWILDINTITYDVSVINLLVGLLLVPRLMTSQNTVTGNLLDRSDVFYNQSKLLKNTAGGTLIGMISGFLPGPTATIASSLAYKIGPGDLRDRVIRAEAANNSVIIVGAMIFMILNIPLALDTITINELLTRTGFNQGLHTIIDATFILIILFSTIIAWLLARNSLKLYAVLAKSVNSKILSLVISTFLIMIDLLLSHGSYSLLMYATWLLVFSVIGIACWNNKISVMPGILGFILGPTLIWTTFQLYM
jgi:TctA family transporter